MWTERHGGRTRLYAGDCRDALEELPSNSVDAISTDPPYALVSVVKRFGKEGSAPAKHGSDGLYARASGGFMGKKWDTGEVAFAAEFWAQCLRVLKPGGHLVAMGGTRTYHRLACAIEDAGFDIRDQLAWAYGTGFPKSHDEGEGRGTALKPAWEPMVLARKNLSEGTIKANLAKWGTGALWIEKSRVPDGNRWPANLMHDGSPELEALFPEGVSRFFYTAKATRADREEGTEHLPKREAIHGADNKEGGLHVSNAKRSKANFHPTVKPTPLMAWINGLICPPGGVILDPFMGSGSTGKAALQAGFRFLGVENDPEYMPIAEARLDFAADSDY